jgi:hypothetical protein
MRGPFAPRSRYETRLVYRSIVEALLLYSLFKFHDVLENTTSSTDTHSISRFQTSWGG